MRFLNTIVIMVLLGTPILTIAESKQGKSFLPDVQSL